MNRRIEEDRIRPDHLLVILVTATVALLSPAMAFAMFAAAK